MASLETRIPDVFCFYKFFRYSVILRALELPGKPRGRLDLYRDVMKVFLF